MRNHRLVAGIAAALITLGGVLSVTAGGAPALPPPVTLRGPEGGSPEGEIAPVVPDGLEVVPAPVIELGSPTPDTTISTVDSPVDPATTSTSVPLRDDTADSPDVTEDDSVGSDDSADSADD